MLIALIEDDAKDRELTKHAILKEISDAIFEEFWMVELALESQSKWDCVLLDLWLPQTKGIESFQRLIVSRPEVPVIILTGLEDLQVAQKAIEEGALFYFIKDHINSKTLAWSIRLAVFQNQLQETKDVVDGEGE